MPAPSVLTDGYAEMKKILGFTALLVVVSFCALTGAQSTSQEVFSNAVKEFNASYAKAKPSKLVVTGSIVTIRGEKNRSIPVLKLKVGQDGIALVTALKDGKPTAHRTFVPIKITEILKETYSSQAEVLTNLPAPKGPSWNQLEVKFLTSDYKKRTSLVVKL